MDVISHRDLRNQSGEVLRRVARGETLVVTNNGEPAALIGPVVRTVMDDLQAAGAVRAATQPPGSLRSITRRSSAATSAEILRDSRGQW